MKKNNVLLIIALSVIVFSCGKKEGNKEAAKDTAAKKEIVNECGCNELTLTDDYVRVEDEGIYFGYLKGIKKEGSKELFTGTCTEKDQNDSIIEKVDVKNGWLIKKVLKEKIGKIYVTTMSVNFENEKPSNGWYMNIKEIYGSNEKYVSEYQDYKNGKTLNFWRATIDHNVNTISITGDYKNGESFDIKDFQPKCMPDSEFEAPYSSSDNGKWRLIDISPQKQNEVINCLKGELSHFDYWKI